MKILEFFEKLAHTAFDHSMVRSLINAQPDAVKQALNLNETDALKSLMHPEDIKCEANHAFVVHMA